MRDVWVADEEELADAIDTEWVTDLPRLSVGQLTATPSRSSEGTGADVYVIDGRGTC